MAISPVNTPLAQQIQGEPALDLPQLCPIIRLDINQAISSAQLKGTIYRIIGSICVVAFFIIFGKMLAAYLAYKTLPTWALVALPFAGAATLKATAILKEAKIVFNERDSLKKIKATIDAIAHWNRPEIENYLESQNLYLSHIENDESTMQALTTQNPTAPLKGLIPLIARCLVLNEEGQNLFTRHQALAEIFHTQPLNSDLQKRLSKKIAANGEKLALNGFFRAVNAQNLLQPTREFLLEYQSANKICFSEKIGESKVKIGFCSLDPARLANAAETIIDYPRNLYFPTIRDSDHPAIDEEALSNESPNDLRALIFGES